MKKIIFFLLFKVVWLICQVWMATESLINGFLSYIYIPLFHSNINSAKIIKDLATLEKKPSDQLTFVFEIRSSRGTRDIETSASKLVRYARIVEEALNPSVLNCYLDTSFVKASETEELKQMVEHLLLAESSKINILFSVDFDYGKKINADKSKITPLVVVFSSYPSILGLHPSYLVGAEIAFRPQLLKATDYDLYSSLQSYAVSEQRKGK